MNMDFYASHFGFRENPFHLTPDPAYLYLSRQHRDALSHLLYGIGERKGFVVITGGIGMGKTTLCRALLAELDPSVATALIFNAAVSELELLAAVQQEFGIAPGRGRKTRKRCLDGINTFLLKNYSNGGNAVVIIDEAQNCSPHVLEQIRMLSNLETEREKLLQIVLMGQPELREILEAPALRQLNERIMVRYHLEPLDEKQSEAYIRHRLAMAAGDENKVDFTAGALRLIHRRARGNPRRINGICDRALLVAYTKDTVSIHRGIVRAAVRDLGGPFEKGGRLSRFPGTGASPWFAAAFLAGLVFFLFLWILVRG